jgi:hypothetical protein
MTMLMFCDEAVEARNMIALELLVLVVKRLPLLCCPSSGEEDIPAARSFLDWDEA